MNVTSEVVGQLAGQIAPLLQEKHGFATQTQIDKAVADILKKTAERQARGSNFSLSKMIRGLRIESGQPAINKQSAEGDVAYVRAMSTGSTPGSYLVPTIEADEIIGYLNSGGVARAAGVRIWPLAGTQKMTIPAATAAPTWVWMAQNSQQTATDPNLSQVSFDLKERRALVAIPNQLLAVSVPALDTLLSELIGLGAAEHEDTAFFSSTNVSGAFTALVQAAGITTVNAGGGSGNGGNLTYADILTVLAKQAANKAKPPFVWIASPRTVYQRIMGLLDLSSRPLYIPTLTQGLQQTGVALGTQGPVGMLMGYPLFCTPAISEAEAVGSGTNQSHMIFTNPRYCHIAQDENIEIAISTERFFDSNQTAIRATQHEDAAYSPAAGITVLQGIN
jgi:HK97 family phage major capsid protein